MGGTLTAIGGHNLLEPARLDCALIAGPHLENFRDLERRLTDADALIRIRNAASLAAAVASLLDNGQERERLAAAAATVAAEQDDVLERVMDMLAPHLDGLPQPAEAAQ